MALDPCKRQDLEVMRGTSLVLDILLKDEEGQPIDLTDGYECQMQVRKSFGGEIIMQATSEGGTPTIALGADGVITIHGLVPEDAPLIEAVYDVILSAPDGFFPIVKGKVKITDKVTVWA